MMLGRQDFVDDAADDLVSLKNIMSGKFLFTQRARSKLTVQTEIPRPLSLESQSYNQAGTARDSLLYINGGKATWLGLTTTDRHPSFNR